jgi:hypothetical protein
LGRDVLSPLIGKRFNFYECLHHRGLHRHGPQKTSIPQDSNIQTSAMPNVMSGPTRQNRFHSPHPWPVEQTKTKQCIPLMLTCACLSTCDKLKVMDGKLSTEGETERTDTDFIHKLRYCHRAQRVKLSTPQRLRHYCHRAQRVKLSTPQGLRHYCHRAQRVTVEHLTPQETTSCGDHCL